MPAKKKNSANKMSKYKTHFWITESNKKRNVERQKKKEEKKRLKLKKRKEWV